jgi:hypothetical protein
MEGLLGLVIALVAGSKILSKAGYSPWFCLLLIVPLVNIVMIFVFAYSEWPILKEIRTRREAGREPVPGGYPPPSMSSQPYPPYGPGGNQYPTPGGPPPAGGAAPSWPGSMPPPPPPPPAPPVSGY